MNQADYIIITGIILSKSRKYHHLLEITYRHNWTFYILHIHTDFQDASKKLFMPCKIKNIYIFSKT